MPIVSGLLSTQQNAVLAAVFIFNFGRFQES